MPMTMSWAIWPCQCRWAMWQCHVDGQCGNAMSMGNVASRHLGALFYTRLCHTHVHTHAYLLVCTCSCAQLTPSHMPTRRRICTATCLSKTQGYPDLMLMQMSIHIRAPPAYTKRTLLMTSVGAFIHVYKHAYMHVYKHVLTHACMHAGEQLAR